jgi:hypothetical protein
MVFPGLQEGLKQAKVMAAKADIDGNLSTP